MDEGVVICHEKYFDIITPHPSPFLPILLRGNGFPQCLLQDYRFPIQKLARNYHLNLLNRLQLWYYRLLPKNESASRYRMKYQLKAA